MSAKMGKVGFVRSVIWTVGLCLLTPSGGFSKSSQDQINQPLPRLAPAARDDNFDRPQFVEPKNVPDFPVQAGGATSSDNTNISAAGAPRSDTPLKVEAASTVLPLQTRLKLVLETGVDSKTSRPGDIFEAHVRDDLFIGSNLLLPKGSLVRGRIAEVNRARLISRAAKIGLKLEQIATPTGEVIPLDAAIDFRRGVSNQKGQLDPGTNFGTRVGDSVRTVSGANSTGATKDAIVAANIATLGVPTIATAIGSSAIALFSKGDQISLGPGQEIEVLLTNDLGLQIN
jgi:hypothetical protein